MPRKRSASAAESEVAEAPEPQAALEPPAAEEARTSKAELIRQYLRDHPKARTSEVQRALQEQGISVSSSQISGIRTAMKEKKRRQRALQRQKAREAQGAQSAEAPAAGGDDATLLRLLTQERERLQSRLGSVEELIAEVAMRLHRR